MVSGRGSKIKSTSGLWLILCGAGRHSLYRHSFGNRMLRSRHDAAAQLDRITAPTQITFGRHDLVTSIRFADQLTRTIRGSELLIFEDCAHAPIYERVEEFNQKILAFLRCQGLKR